MTTHVTNHTTSPEHREMYRAIVANARVNRAEVADILAQCEADQTHPFRGAMVRGVRASLASVDAFIAKYERKMEGM